MNTTLTEINSDEIEELRKDYYAEYYPNPRVEKAIFNFLDQDYYAGEDDVFYTIYKKENDWFVNREEIEKEITKMFGLHLPERIKVGPGEDDYIEPARNPIPGRVIRKWATKHQLKLRTPDFGKDIAEDLEYWGVDGDEMGPIKENTTNKLTNKFLTDFWPQYRNQVYSELYNTYHPSAYVEGFNRPSSQFENALEVVGDAVKDGKRFGLLDSSVGWQDLYHKNDRGIAPTTWNEDKEEWEESKILTDDNGLPTLRDQLEIIDNTNLDWIHGILLFDVLEDIVDEFKSYCGENGVDESGMGKCMDDFPPSPNHEQINRTGGTLKQDYYTLYNFMKELERTGVNVKDYMKSPIFPNIIKLVDDGTTDYDITGEYSPMRQDSEAMDAEEILMDVPERMSEQVNPEDYGIIDGEKKDDGAERLYKQHAHDNEDYVDNSPFTRKEILILKQLHKNLTRGELQNVAEDTPTGYGTSDKKFWGVMKLFGIEYENDAAVDTRSSIYAKWALDNWTEDGDYGSIEQPIKTPLKWYEVDRAETGSQIEYKDGTAEVLGFDEDDAGNRADSDFYSWGGDMETTDYGDYESYDSSIDRVEFQNLDEQYEEEEELTQDEIEMEIDRLKGEIDVDQEIIKKAEDEISKMDSPDYLGVGVSSDDEEEKKTVIGIGKDASAFKKGKYLAYGAPQQQSDLALSQQGVYEQENTTKKDNQLKVDTGQSDASIELEKSIKKNFVDLQKSELEKKEEKLKKLKNKTPSDAADSNVMGKGDSTKPMDSGEKEDKDDGYFDLVDIIEEDDQLDPELKYAIDQEYRTDPEMRDSILQSLDGGENNGKYYLNPEGAELNVPPIKIAQKFSDVNDYGKIKFDMQGGNGIAYFTDKNLVIKLTTDDSEYFTANKLVDEDNEYIVKVFESAKIKTSHTVGYDLFVIVLEALPMTEEMEQRWSDCCCGQNSPIHIDYLEEPALVLPPVANYDECQPIYDNIMGIQKNFKEYGIVWSDIGIDNMGIKEDGKLAVIDLGETRGGITKGQEVMLNLENIKIRPLSKKQIKKQLILI